MAIWAIADLHLSFGVPGKEMDLFGAKWKDHHAKIADNWKRLIAAEDLVLIPGDISWALHLEEAVPDLQWIDALPGTKVMIRGNHDFWWSSLSKIEKVLPKSIRIIQNNIFLWNGIAICGARLWDTQEYSFGQYIVYQDNPKEKALVAREGGDEAEKIFQRELQRLEMSLKAIPKQVSTRIAMTHYPPIGSDLAPTRASALLEKYGISQCVFGHLHNVREGALPFGTARGVTYTLTSCDYTNFSPIPIPI